MALCPPLVGEPDWTDLPHPALTVQGTTFLRAQPEDGLKVAYFRSAEGHMKARAWFGPGTQGPPGHAHGGSMAALLDEVVGGAAWMAGYPVLAATLTVRFRTMLPLETTCVATGWVERASGRRVQVRGDIRGPEGTLYAEAEGTFVVVDPDRLPPMPPGVADTLQKLMSTVLPKDGPAPEPTG